MNGLCNMWFWLFRVLFAYSASLWVLKSVEDTIHFRSIDKRDLAGAY